MKKIKPLDFKQLRWENTALLESQLQEIEQELMVRKVNEIIRVLNGEEED